MEWDVFCASFLSYWLRFSCLGHLILWFQHMAMVQIQTKDEIESFTSPLLPTKNVQSLAPLASLELLSLPLSLSESELFDI